MKLPVYCILLILNVFNVLGTETFDPNTHDWLMFPGGDGRDHLAVLHGDVAVAKGKLNKDRVAQSGTSDVLFYLYSRQNPLKATIIDTNDLHDASFDSSRPTKIIVHGYATSSQADWVLRMKNAFLRAENCQVIVMDWSALVQPPLYHVAAQEHTSQAAQLLAELLKSLVLKHGAKTSDMHLIGHNLGAHVAGLAGKHMTRILLIYPKVARITALDPALPLFDATKGTMTEDATFVDVIHTCGDWLGISQPIGHADFYPNGGKCSQPGCESDFSGSCSHNRAYEFFTESITSNAFRAVACASYVEYETGTCSRSTHVPMGYHVDDSASGTYYLVTAAKSPFALG